MNLKIRYLFPFGIGYYYLTRDYFRVELEDVLENLVLYFVIGIVFGFYSDLLVGIFVVVSCYVFITFLEYRIIKKLGHLFPKVMDWDQVQNNKRFTLKLFYLLMLHSLYSCIIGMLFGNYILKS